MLEKCISFQFHLIELGFLALLLIIVKFFVCSAVYTFIFNLALQLWRYPCIRVGLVYSLQFNKLVVSNLRLNFSRIVVSIFLKIYTLMFISFFKIWSQHELSDFYFRSFRLCLRLLLDYYSTMVTTCSNPNTSRGCICQYTQKPRIKRVFEKPSSRFSFAVFLFPLCCPVALYIK